MRTAETLFHDEKDYQRAIRVLERVSKHILWKFAVVGGIANRALFPEWGEMNQSKKFNDLDLVLLPLSRDEGTAPLSVSIKKDYFITYIGELARYFGMIDKTDYMSVDIFTCGRYLETQEMELEGKRYIVLTPEERYFSMARDIYQTLTNGRILDPKHIKFLEFLKDKINQEKVDHLWSEEEKIIKRNEAYPFSAMKEYLEQINKLTSDKKDLIEEKIPGTQKRPYNLPRAEAFGITIENETDFYAAYARKRELFGE
ncbi:hypothetical protein EXS71_03500 [Candidatus Uhrbacteria bacterium]|nr:hypothetical protein [Candidatus Uhrbacteria bacterium]